MPMTGLAVDQVLMQHPAVEQGARAVTQRRLGHTASQASVGPTSISRAWSST